MQDNNLNLQNENNIPVQNNITPSATPQVTNTNGTNGEYHYNGAQINNDGYNVYPKPAGSESNYTQSTNPVVNSEENQANPSNYTSPSYSSYSYPTGTQNYSNKYSKKEYDSGNGGNNGKKSLGLLSIIAIVLLSTITGFGGGALAYELLSQDVEPSIVYKAPDDANANAGNSDILDVKYDFADIAEIASPSVVSIITGTYVSNLIPSQGAGSGVILSQDGYIITNHHVVDGATSINVILHNGDEYSAAFVGSDKESDIAVIKINVTGLNAATIGDSDNLRVGQPCLAIGNPMGNLGGTVTNGIISALSREINIDGVSMTLLQMSAPVSPGNSGGGLFDANGNLIGIVNAKSSGDNSEGLGFAIPVNTAIKISEALIYDGHVSRPALGVYVITYTFDDEAIADGYEKAGIYIAQVNPGGAAEKSGLEVGDRIVKFNGVTITRTSSLHTELEKYRVGDIIELVVERGEELLTFEVELLEKES